MTKSLSHPPEPFDDREVWPGPLTVFIPEWRWERLRRWQRETDVAFARAVVAAAERGDPLPSRWGWRLTDGGGS